MTSRTCRDRRSRAQPPVPVCVRIRRGAPNKAEFLRALADRAAKQLKQDDTHWKQWVLDWKLVEDDPLTEFERFQLEDGGEIKYPAEVIVLEPEQSAASPNAAAA